MLLVWCPRGCKALGSASMDLDVCKQSICDDICCLELPWTSALRRVWPQGTSVHGNEPQVALYQVNKSHPFALFPIPSGFIPFPPPPRKAPASNESQTAQPTATQHLPPHQGRHQRRHTDACSHTGCSRGKGCLPPGEQFGMTRSKFGWEGTRATHILSKPYGCTAWH